MKKRFLDKYEKKIWFHIRKRFSIELSRTVARGENEIYVHENPPTSLTLQYIRKWKTNNELTTITILSSFQRSRFSKNKVYRFIYARVRPYIHLLSKIRVIFLGNHNKPVAQNQIERDNDKNKNEKVRFLLYSSKTFLCFYSLTQLKFRI